MEVNVRHVLNVVQSRLCTARYDTRKAVFVLNFFTIQFKDGDPVSSQLINPVAIQTCEQYKFSYIYTKQHRFIGQTQLSLSYKKKKFSTL